MSSTVVPTVLPAQLSFLAIYNPSLSSSDEDLHKQIVFYYSKASRTRQRTHGKASKTKQDAPQPQKQERDEQLLQVGLAQGMVGFARSFSNGEAVESIDTDRQRIVLTELEEGFWILASIDLTRLPAVATASQAKPASSAPKPQYEYSSREVSPPMLLIQQLKAAYSIFCLHHTRLRWVLETQGRDNFERVLHKFWSVFAKRWDVLLHGSPVVDIFGGLKLASGGELGVGVGEEEWGSPERDVLEGYVRSTDGLVDVVVSRFGESEPSQSGASSKPSVGSSDPERWLGNGRLPGPSDGVVFAGTGAITRQSLRDVSLWLETIYTYGEHAYGVQVNPTSGRDRAKRRVPEKRASSHVSEESPAPVKPVPSPELAPGIPRPIVQTAESSLRNASRTVEAANSKPDSSLPSLGDVNAWAKYLSIPYGSMFGGSKESVTKTEDQGSDSQDQHDSGDAVTETAAQIRRERAGYFLVGLQGDLDDEDAEDARIPHRLLHVEREEDAMVSPMESPIYEREMEGTTLVRKLSRLRSIVYVHRPFVYVFLFESSTPLLTFSGFYRTLHSFFSPLNASFSKSTSPERVARRIFEATHPYTTDPEPNRQTIYDVVYDARTLMMHSTMPNIPEPGTLVAEGLGGSSLGWSRVEALHVYSHLLGTVSESRGNADKIEQTCKTSRGWWVTWMRLPPSGMEESKTETDGDRHSADFNTSELREAFVVRRGRDAVGVSAKSSARFSSGMWGLGAGTTEQKTDGAAAGRGPKGLAEGIGIDARRYIEEVLSLCR